MNEIYDYTDFAPSLNLPFGPNIFLFGDVGSGKNYYAERFLNENKNKLIIFNMDGNDWPGSIEDNIEESEIYRFIITLNPGYDKLIFIDNVHNCPKNSQRGILFLMCKFPKVKFFFLSSNNTKVIPGIIARCKVFNVPLMSKNTYYEFLELCGIESEKDKGLIYEVTNARLKDTTNILRKIRSMSMDVQTALQRISELSIIKLAQAYINKNKSEIEELDQTLKFQGFNYQEILEELIYYFLNKGKYDKLEPLNRQLAHFIMANTKQSRNSWAVNNQSNNQSITGHFHNNLYDILYKI